MEINNPILRQIWADRYKKGNETIDDNIKRVAKYCSSNDKEELEFISVMQEGLFYPAGRTMSNSGVGKDLTLNNCFVAPQIKDDLSDIFDKVKLGSKTHQKGGGIGYDFSQLRPSGTPTSNEAVASGAVSFMDVFNAQTATILQGNRRGANMGVMCVYSMDIEEFINAKSYEAQKLNHFNVSVMVDDDFMNAVEEDKEISLHFPVYNDEGKIIKDESKWTQSKKISARYIWNMIMKKAYDNGEPGIFQYDNMNRDNTLWYIENIVCSNPCAEYLAGTVYGENPITQELLDSADYGGACNLGSLFLHRMIDNPFTINASVNYEKLSKTIKTSVKFLDSIIDINNFPDKIYENYQKSFRTIGLGITGLADMLVMLNIKYNSNMAVAFIDDLFDFIAKESFKASIELAKEKGSFPFLDREKYIQSGFIKKHIVDCGNDDWSKIADDILKYGIRNAKIMSIAPTGTLSLTFGENCSSGLEPIFSLEYDRKVKMGGQSEEDTQIVKMRDFAYGEWLKFKDNADCIVKEDVFVTAMNMNVNAHIEILSAIAYHVDMSCSKTINIPTSYSFEDTKKVYIDCWKKGIKGCTIFRPNEIRQGILITESKEETNIEDITESTVKELPWGTTISCSDDLIGRKRKIVSGCGNIHVQAWFDPMDGRCMEVFLSKGSTGGCNSFMISLSRMTSLALRTGTSFELVIDQLKSIPTCASYAVRASSKRDTSKGNCCPTALSNAMIEMQNEVYEELGIDEDCKEDFNYQLENKTKPVTSIKPIKEALKKSNICPECGEDVIFEGGCIQCKSCGWSKCD